MIRHRLSTFPAASLVLLALSVTGCGAQEQPPPPPPPPEVSEGAAELLAATPLGQQREGVLSTTDFVSQTNALLAYRQATVEQVDSAVRALEELAAYLGPVSAKVRSTPPGIQVMYRRVYEPEEGDYPVVTTDGEELLDIPTWYIFTATDPSTGEKQSQRKNCLHGCTVVFAFQGAGGHGHG